MNSNSQNSVHIFIRTCWENNSPFIDSMLYWSCLLPQKNATLILKKVFKASFNFPLKVLLKTVKIKRKKSNK